MSKRVAIVPIFIVLCASLATGAELTTLGAGGMLNGSASEAPAALKAGDAILGPATVSTAGGSIRVPAQSILEVRAPDGETELFFVKKGSARGKIGSKTQVAVPLGWLAPPSAKTVDFYAETVSASRAFLKVNVGEALVAYKEMSIFLREGQGIELWIDVTKKSARYFSTPQANPGIVEVFANVTKDLEIKLAVPKATSGSLEPVPGDRTKIASDPGSWTGGKVGIETSLSGVAGQKGSLGPGTFALINNSTGEIEFGFVEVDFAIIERAISLTSEFATLYASNFTSLAVDD